MDSTYIIVLKNENDDKFAFLRVIRFEPYISLHLNVKLFDNYEELSRQILQGENLDFGNSIQKQVEIMGDDYAQWIKDHDHIYKLVASTFKLTFLYKRKLITSNNTQIK